MNEKDLISLWNEKRSQIIAAQMQPALVLIAAFVLSTLGYFDKATDSAKYFALVVIAITGILTTVNQYAAIREGESICEELSKVAKTGPLAKKIAGSKNFVSLTGAVIVVADIAVFVFAYMAIFGMQLNNLLIWLAPLVITLGVFVYVYERPKKPKAKSTGRGGDFAEQ